MDTWKIFLPSVPFHPPFHFTPPLYSWGGRPIDHLELFRHPRASALMMLEIGYTDVVCSILFKNVKFVQIG